jgi:hypothetical membrane protein
MHATDQAATESNGFTMNVLRTVTAGVFVLGSAVYLAGETIAAAAWKSPTYSYTQNWISDLGSATAGEFQGRVLNSPQHAVMNAGFIVQGLLIGVAIVLLSRTLGGRTRRFTSVMAVVIAIGYILVGTFHGSLQAQQNGTLPLHFTGAALAIFGGNTLALVLGLHWRKNAGTRTLGLLSIVVGALGLLAAVVLMSTFNADVPSGLIERGSVYSIVLWELLVAVALLRSPVAATTTATQGVSAQPRSTRAL